jgi:hypothetical protein
MVPPTNTWGDRQMANSSAGVWEVRLTYQPNFVFPASSLKPSSPFRGVFLHRPATIDFGGLR